MIPNVEHPGAISHKQPLAIPFDMLSGRPLPAIVRKIVENILRLHTINHIYTRIPDTQPGIAFAERILEVMDISSDLPESQLAKVPDEGPLVVVANHPFGGIEGLILLSHIHKRRADARALANFFLHLVPELRDLFIFVNPFQGKGSVRQNVTPLKESMDWLRQGKTLIVFPSGEVSHFTFACGRVEDPPWSPTVARIARKSGATVLPVFVDGRNSTLFQVAGLLHPMLRTILLPRELLNKSGHHVSISIGPPVPHTDIRRFRSDHEVTSHLRAQTYQLRGYQAAKTYRK